MMSPTLPPAPIAAPALLDAIAVLRAAADADAIVARLESLQAATAAHDEKLKVLGIVEPELRRREAALNEGQTLLAERESVVVERIAKITTKENALADREAQIERDFKDRDLNLRAREQGLAEREKALADLRQKLAAAANG